MLLSGKTAGLIVVAWFCACTSMVCAKTLTVMQDGSGGFQQIQPALDAVASGDTLYIGPGDYVDFNTMYFPGYPEDPEVYAFIPVDDLTIIGAGRDETVVGPETYEVVGGTYSPICFRWQGGGTLRLSGLTMRNCFEGIHSDPGIIYVDDCNFLDNYDGVFWETRGSGGGLFNCQIETSVIGSPAGVFFLGEGSDILIEDCFFDGATVIVQNLENITIRGCEMKNAIVGLQVDNGTHCLVEECRIFNCSNVGIYVAPPASTCEIVDSEVSGEGAAVYVVGFSELIVTNAIFYGGYWAVIDFSNANDSVMTNSRFYRGTGLLIRSSRHPDNGPVTHDLRNNNWGMSNAEEIRALILDGTNDPDNVSTVLFEPFVGDLSPADTPKPMVSLSVHPNPFNPRTTVSFTLDQAQSIELSIFDMTGKRIAMLADHEFQPGAHSLAWQGTDQQGRAVASGTYLVRMSTDEGATSEKIMLVR